MRRAWAGLVVVVAVIYLLPFAVEVGTSLQTEADAAAGGLHLLPHPVTLDAWREVLGPEGTPVMQWLATSIGVTTAVTAGRVVFDTSAGYALSRLHFRGRSTVLALLLGLLAVPGVVLLIPLFLVVHYLGIYDSHAAMVLPLLVDAAGVYIMKQSFDSLPVEVEEAARLDGASTLRILWSVVLPMARPALATLAVLSFQGTWNEFSHFLVTTSSPQYRTLVTGLAELTAGGLGQGTRYPVKMATALVTTLPVVLVFLVAQRYVVRTGNRDGIGG